MGKRRVTRRKRVTKRRKAKKKVVKRKKARKALKKNEIGSRRKVFNGTKVRTTGSLRQGDLVKNKRGKIVSKKASAEGKKRYKKNLQPWIKAFVQARKNLGLTGFVACKKGSAFYKEAMRLYKK